MKLHTLLLFIAGLITACSSQEQPSEITSRDYPAPEYSLTADQTHSRWSRLIEPVLTVPSGSVIEVFTEEASAGQLTPESTLEDLGNLDFDPIHPLTGPVYIEDAEPGDVLKVTLHKIELGGWGWTAVIPGFGFLADEFDQPWLKTFTFEEGGTHARFSDDISIPLKPFPGVMGVAPDTDEMLSTIPPRYNGGNMDDPHMVEGTTIYFPVFVEGALFSIGDTHAAQGMGEVCGTAIEAPMRIVYEVEVLKGGRTIPEPEYESEDFYAVTAFGETIDEAAEKATRYMIDYLEAEHGMDRYDAYALASLAGNLKIAEVVDVPHMLVTMHMPKEVIGME
ncbi:acetamidase/formamidase family protein [Rhodohalobacter halophilus]|uniref:acetamidase/formamidase family protein n=1 Tax=Rhodohalobacter halophilus TaxID=1812810 RepID=UPI0009FF3EDE|nr:acetamidase/formamidase family protein [Rhodohalobacter halophilus]